jgi:hypothetical protein
MATEFLGAALVSFDIKGGFNGQEIALDASMTDCSFMSPTFNPPTIGSPVLFEHEGYEFYGILESLKKDGGPGKLYSAQVTSGNHIINSVELILNDYYGSVNSVPNLMNVFGYMENLGGFGASNVNSAGMSWVDIATTVTTLCNNFAGNSYGAPICYKGFKYKIDLSNLPAIPAFYRINNDSINLMDFIADVCSAGGHDFFIRLNKPTSGEYSAGWAGTFQVITISRINEPELGRIDEFIETTPCVSSKNYGQELRKDVNSKFVVGANVERLYFNYTQDLGNDNEDDDEISIEEYSNDTILPFLGVNAENNVIIGFTPSGEPNEYYFNVDISDINIPVATGEYLSCLGELRAARKGRASWERYLADRNCNGFIIDPQGTSYSDFHYGAFPLPKYGAIELARLSRNDFLAQYPLPGDRWIEYPHNDVPNIYFDRARKLKISHGNIFSFPRIMEDDIYEKSLTNPTSLAIYEQFKKSAGITDTEWNLLSSENLTTASRKEDDSLGNFNDNKTDQLYRRLKGIADTYYNRKFMVSIPFTMGAYEPESNNIRMSQDVTNEGFLDESIWGEAYTSGWIPDISGINTLLTTENKFYPFVKFNNCVGINASGEVDRMLFDFSEIGPSDKIFSAPITVSGIDIYDCWIKCTVDEKVYFQDSQTLYGPRAVIEIPGSIKRNRQTDFPSYMKGAFTAFTLATGVGGAFYGDPTVTEDFLKASFDKLAGDDAIWHDGEEIVYAELYAIPLRSKLLTYGPWYAVGASGKVSYERNQELNPWNYGGFDAMNDAGLARVQDGITNQTFSEMGSVTINGAPSINFGDVIISGGPYVTDISCSFGTNGITTTYGFQAWSSHRSLSKLNGFSLERNKRIRDSIKEIKSNFREGLKNGRFKDGGDFYNKVSNRFIDLNDYTRKERPSTSHKIIAGEINGFDTSMAIQPNYNAGAQAHTNFADKAFMSIDGLLQPFSVIPKTGWPSFEMPDNSGVAGSGEANSQNLNPFQPKNSIKVLSYGQDTTTGGLLRSSGEAPAESGGFTDYRGNGLRLPAIGVGWGYSTNGSPVPSGSGENGFREDYLYNKEHWKAGPIDLKWDDSRKVWTSGGSGAPRIRFTILSTAFTIGFGALGCDHVIVRVDHISCGGMGVQVGDEVKVYDPEYCHFNLPIELLIGLSGTATWMKSENYQPDLGYITDCVSELQTTGCMWMIDTLCCSEEEIIGG